jgi:hypothetical protein
MEADFSKSNDIEKFIKEYKNIDVPSYYKFKKPKIEGNPKIGNFITFQLNETSTVYFLKDSVGLSPYWLNKFSTTKRYNKNWYFDCTSLNP